MLENYDFESLERELGTQHKFEPIETKIIFEDFDNLDDIMHTLTILCDLELIKDFELSKNWSLTIHK